MTDFSKAYTAIWSLYRVDPETWADSGEVGRLVSASLNHETDGDAPEVVSGSIEIANSPLDRWENGYYRLVMRAEQGGVERYDIATLLCESGSGTVDYGLDSKEIAGHSVLHPAAKQYVRIGEFCPAGTNAANKVAEMLSECVAAPISVEGSFSLADSYNFEPSMTVLQACWVLLRAGGFCMYPDGRGVIHICPLPTEPSLVLDRSAARLLSTGVQHSLDWSDVPNRYTADDDGIRAVAENNVPGSPTSHNARGYWADVYDGTPTRLSGETLTTYAARMLEELSIVEDSRTYTRRYDPNVHVFSMVRGSMPSVRLDADMRVKSQALDCSNGITVTETACQEVRSWQRTDI